MTKIRRNISLDETIDKKLAAIAKLRHSNVSQIITDWVVGLPDPVQPELEKPKHKAKSRKEKTEDCTIEVVDGQVSLFADMNDNVQ